MHGVALSAKLAGRVNEPPAAAIDSQRVTIMENGSPFCFNPTVSYIFCPEQKFQPYQT